MPKTFSILGLVLLVTSQCYGAGGEKKFLGNRDSSFIGIAQYPWNFRLYSVNKGIGVVLRTSSDSLPSANYNPRDKIGIGIGTFYRSIGIWTGLRIDAFDKNKKGLSLDLQLNQYGDRFSNDFYFQYYQGLYLENPEGFSRFSPIPTSTLYRKDLQVLNYGINTNYYFNWKKFSIRAAFIQSEFQKKSAGSMVIGGSFANFNFAADSSIIPNSELFVAQSIRSGNFLSFAGNFGYSHTFVWKKHLYASMSAIAGPGLSSWSYLIDDASGNKGIRPSIRFGGRFSLGYNSERFFTGISAVFDQFTIFFNDNNIQYTYGNVRLFIGYRPDFSSGK